MRQLLIICAILCNWGLAAQPTFNLVYDNGGRTELSFFSAEVGNSGQYLVTTSSFGGVVDEFQVLKIDPTGKPIDTLRLNIPGKHFFPENLVQTPDSNYIATGTLFETNPDDGDYFVYKFSADLDSIWFKTFEFGTGNEGAKKIKTTNDGGFFIAAFSQTFPDNDAQNYLFKIDSTGQKEWALIHGDTTRNEEPYDVVQLHDSSYLVLSRRVYPDNDNILLLRISPQGKLIWEKELKSWRLTIATIMLPITEEKLLLGGISRTSVNGNSNAYVAMIDTSGALHWQKYYGGTKSGWFADGTITNDGNVVFAGNQSGIDTYQGNRDGYVVKLDTSGNVLWSRIVNPTGTFEHEYNDYFYGVLATSDGGLLCTGFTGQGPVSNTQDAWIMKLDSTGLCDTATCFPWLVSVPPPPTQEKLQVWPNPASDHVFIELPNAHGVLRMMDIQGKEIIQHAVSTNHTTISVHHLPHGLYMLVWEIDGEVQGIEKVVVHK